MKDAELQSLSCDGVSAAGDERDVATTSGAAGPFSPALHREWLKGEYANAIWEKASQQLLFLRKLQDGDIALMTFYFKSTLLESVLSFSMICSFGTRKS